MKRLKKNYQFMRVYRRGKAYRARYLILYVLPNGSDENRVGISISKKFGKSVSRNRMKRLIKENYRQHIFKKSEGHDLVFVVKSGEKDFVPDFETVKKEVKYLLFKIGE